MKRIFDILAAIIGLIFLAPLFVMVGLLIFLEDGNPVFFRQVRVGKNGRSFRIFKFRSMRNNNTGLKITAGADPRITKIGEFLRKSKIDELPQLINILRGEMSLVGPRPEVPEYVNQYSNEQRNILKFTPGITAPSSLKFSQESEVLALQKNPEQYYVEFLMPEKISADLQYFNRANFLSDLILILKTISKVILSRETEKQLGDKNSNSL